MARTKTVTIEGEQFVIAPLTIEQVENYMDDRPPADDSKAWRAKILSVIASSLNNATGASNGDLVTIADLKKRLDLVTHDQLHRAVLDISGLKVATEGEAQAVASPESTSSTSAAV